MARKFKTPIELVVATSDPTVADGDLWYRSDTNAIRGRVNGTSYDLNGVETFTFAWPGTLVTATGTLRQYVEGAYKFVSARASVNTVPTGATIICDINKNGTTIYTTQGNRPAIAISGNTITANSPDVTTFASGDYLSVDIDQIGSTIAGADLTVQIRLQRT